MFKKERKNVNPNMTDTLIGEKSSQEGVITSQASLRVEGKVTGEIDCKGDLLIGKKGTVLANVRARNVINAGFVEGSIYAEGLLTITSSGKVVGDIEVKSLNIAEGGIFQGTSMMKSETERKRDDKQLDDDAQNVLHKLESLKNQESRKQDKQDKQDKQEKTKAASGH